MTQCTFYTNGSIDPCDCGRSGKVCPRCDSDPCLCSAEYGGAGSDPADIFFYKDMVFTREEWIKTFHEDPVTGKAATVTKINFTVEVTELEDGRFRTKVERTDEPEIEDHSMVALALDDAVYHAEKQLRVLMEKAFPPEEVTI